MYARLVLFTLGPGMRSTGEKLADQFAPALGAQKGFKSVTFFLDDIVGEYGALSLWESKEDADASSAALDPQLQQALTGIVQGPPTLLLFEVYESKA
jgi:hypothetical protein